METIPMKERVLPGKPEWKIILEHLVYQDQVKLYRICRKMIISLDRLKVPEIYHLLHDLNPAAAINHKYQAFDGNSPKPKGLPFNPNEIIDEVFSIADKYLSDEQITALLQKWIHQEYLNATSIVLERQHAPLADVVSAVKKFISISNANPNLSYNERMGLRAGLIQRLLSDNLNYVNIAKNYVTFEMITSILDRVVGPAQGNGKVGGKSAGLILACQILMHRKRNNPLLENVETPKSWFVTSDALLEFLHYNALEEFTFTKYQTVEEIKQEYTFLEYIFKNSHFPTEFINSLNIVLDDISERPIIVRSSSLLEDSFEASFSGKYKSLFIANTGTKEERMASLINAIAEVYASTFGPDPIEYRKERGLIDFREEMGILIQEVVGTKIGHYYLPSYAGVAFSNNEFRWSPRIRREDGVVRLVAGLGTRAVDRTINEYPTLVSPGQPSLKVNSSYEDKMKYSQQLVDVINLQTNSFETVSFEMIIKECKGNFPAIEKIVSFNKNGTLMEPVSLMANFAAEDNVITFNNLIDKTKFIYQIKEILNILQQAFTRPVDVEFASDGKTLYLLQCRPQSSFENDVRIKLPSNIPQEKIVFSASQYVSNGLIEDIEYVVYVDTKGYSNLERLSQMCDIGVIISKLNRVLKRRSFVLIGPGRWGSKGDIKLGVPVIYSDINNTAMLIEVAREKQGYVPELSFGTHFFQDLVEANIKYLPLYPDKEGEIFNEDFLMRSPNCLNELITGYKEYLDIVKVIKVEDVVTNSKLSICMDGNLGKAIAYIKNS